MASWDNSISSQKLFVCLSVCVLTRVVQIITATRGGVILHGDQDFPLDVFPDIPPTDIIRTIPGQSPEHFPQIVRLVHSTNFSLRTIILRHFPLQFASRPAAEPCSAACCSLLWISLYSFYTSLIPMLPRWRIKIHGMRCCIGSNRIKDYFRGNSFSRIEQH